MKRWMVFVIATAAATAVACGGGGGGNGDTTGQPDVIIGGDKGQDNYVPTDHYVPPDNYVPPDTKVEVYDIGPPPDKGPDQGPVEDQGPIEDQGPVEDIQVPPDCGNGTCGADENQCNCPQDCGACAGCCSAGTCVAGTDNAACGVGGAACQNCLAGGMACQNGTCIPTLDEGSCKAYYFCTKGCPQQPQGQACIQECQGKLSQQGMQDVQNLQNCLQQNGCLDKPTDEELSKCLEDFCIEPYFRCFSGTLYQSCSTLIDCLVSCPDDNPNTPEVNEQSECIGNCWSEATFDAQMDLQNLINCANKQCEAQCQDPESAACNTCWNQVLGPGGACESFNDKCMEYGPEGCYYLLTCLNGCPADDQQCQQNCVNQTSKNGLALYNAIYDCIMQACPVCETNPQDPACDTCFQAAQQQGGACAGALQTCLDDRPYGTKKCGEVFQCVMACPDQQCVQDCFLSGTKTANDLYDAMITCALDACPSCATNPPGADCNTCFDGALQDAAKCKAQYDACMADQAAQ